MDGTRQLADGWEAVLDPSDHRRVVYWRRTLGPRSRIAVKPDGTWRWYGQSRRHSWGVTICAGKASTPTTARRNADDVLDRRPCSTCGGRCLWSVDAWTCATCGDEWYPEHGLTYLPPGVEANAEPFADVDPELVARLELERRAEVLAL